MKKIETVYIMMTKYMNNYLQNINKDKIKHH